jgi:hypothetical protein
MGQYENWVSGVVKNVQAASFGVDPTEQVVSPDGTGTFPNSTDNSPSLPVSPDSGNPATPAAVSPAAQAASALQTANLTSILGTALGPSGTLMSGPLGAIAQQAFENATASTTGQQAAQNRPLSPADVAPTSLPNAANAIGPTDAQTAHDLGLAAANGAAKVASGQIPATAGNLNPTENAARVIAHGVQGAPAAVQSAVKAAIPPHAQNGWDTAMTELGAHTGWVALGFAAAILGFAWYNAKKRAV